MRYGRADPESDVGDGIPVQHASLDVNLHN